MAHPTLSQDIQIWRIIYDESSLAVGGSEMVLALHVSQEYV